MKPNVTKKRILIVDDDPVFLGIFAEYLHADGYSVTAAKNGDEALKMFAESNFDLVISDLYMPGLTGLQLLEFFKSNYPDLPIIVISGASDINNAIAALRLGAWDYIVKPFTRPVLEQTVIRVFEKLYLLKENKKINAELARMNMQLAQGLEQLQSDQKAGENVQQQLLPQTLNQVSDYTFQFKIFPSLYLSGDFVDYFEITKDKVGFYIADVSGHGASSAFVTVLLKELIDQMLSKFKSNHDDTILHPDKVLKHLNDEIFNAHLGKYITMFYCIVDNNNLLTYSVGGHYPNPIIWDGKNSEFLQGHGFAVGIYDKAVFENFTYTLPPFYKILMLSDGVFEIMEGNNTTENEKILLSITNTPNLTMESILDKLKIDRERGYPDDVTLFLIDKSNPNNLNASPN